MIRAYRRVPRSRAATAFDGEGARLHGARWNSPGTRVAYASSSIALATLEVMVNLQDRALLAGYWLASVEFAERLVHEIDLAQLPEDWNAAQAPESLRGFGDDWVRSGRSAVLRVPSAVTGEDNFLLNPHHADFAKIKVLESRAFRADPRLLR